MAARKTAAEKAAENDTAMALAETETPVPTTAIVVQEKNRPVQELLPSTADQTVWTPQQGAIMQQLGITAAPLGFVESFLDQCRRTGLDPLARQIYGINLGGKWTTLVSIDGFRVISERSGKYRGMTPTEWCGEDGTWRDVWLDTKKKPAAARVGIHHADFVEPLFAIATWEGYGKTSGQWVKNGPNMLAKCAEALARRQAFPQDLSGLYSTEEMDRAVDGGEMQAARPRAASKPPMQADTAVEAPKPREIEMRAPKHDWFGELAQVTAVGQLRALFGRIEAADDLWVGVPNPLAGTPGHEDYIPLGKFIKDQAVNFKPEDAAGAAPNRLAQAQAGINTDAPQEAPAE